MSLHTKKHCPRCNKIFECKADNITQCQCFDINLSFKEKTYIKNNFADCICIKCLHTLKDEFSKLN